MIDAATVQANLARVHERLAAAGGDVGAITVVAVTKAFDAPVAAAALAAGIGDLGENYAQQLLAKVAAFADAPPAMVPRWHMIGSLQRNKVPALAPHVDCWQTVDRLSLGTAIARRAPGATVLVQVNATDEPHKGGCPPEQASELVGALIDAGLRVQGLMAVGKAGDDDATARAFTTVAHLADRLDLPVRSMGMSGDLELAVRAGTTMVRVGRDLFGARPDARPGSGGVGD
ncbi:MAG: YggS family pyridoxal phosphate-dependent enzyme [Acidimicrobiales bacterium]|nr:YggS family pyridoxal phosphate-dependent enzyme [Acidimicrobiales bacterium]